MTEMIKHKGYVKTETLREILRNAQAKTNDIVYTKDHIIYGTGKNTFIAKPHGGQYWDISIIFGREGARPV